jgi:hypothetical protein
MDVDVVPVRERPRDGRVGLGIGLAEVVERGVREDHAEAEGVVGAVALEHGDLVGRVGRLHEDREVEARRSPADRDDLHALILPDGPVRNVHVPGTAARRAA